MDRCIEVVQVSVSLLRDFPIDDLQSVIVYTKLFRTTTICLPHLSTLTHSRYDFTRADRLLEVVGTTIFVIVAALLKEKDIMNCTFEELTKIKAQADGVFLT